MLFSTALIVFRESLEAALFVGILAASTRGIAGRSRWLSAGVMAGIVGSLAMAGGMETLSEWADGLGQDLATMAILSIALLMLAWHCIWGSAHAKEMVSDARRMVSDLKDGKGTLWALAIAVTMAVIREGAETVLFVSGIVSGHTLALGPLVASAGTGLLLGAGAGWMIYWGLGKVKPQHLFSVTQVLVILLAGSIASRLAKTLSQAGWVDLGSAPVWNTAWLISDESPVGVFLSALLGYEASPSALQMAFYAGAIVLIHLTAQAVKNQGASARGLSRT